MPKATVYIIGEAESFLRTVRSTVAGSTTLKREFAELSLSASKSAEAQVKASLLRTSRIREEITAIKSLAATYVKGSEEQIAAMNLVAKKQAELNRLQGGSSFGGGRGRGGRLGRDEREASGLLRGGVSGSGFGRIGFSALSGGAFFGSFLAAGAVRTTIDAATQAAAVEKQLAAQYRASGLELANYRKQIDETLSRESALSGFNKDELTQSYTSIFRAAGNTAAALRDEAIAADVARGRHMDLQAASLLVAKVINGNVGILKRYGIETYKGETATEALAAVQQKYAGQAAAGTTAQQRFTAELHNSEVIIGTALLPTVSKLLGEGAKWLDQMDRSGRLQRDVNTVVRDGGIVFHLLGQAVGFLRGALHLVDGVTGSFKNTLELLIGLKLGSSILGWAGNFGSLTSKEKVASAEAQTLHGRLTALGKLGTIAVTVAVAFEVAKGGQWLSKWLGKNVGHGIGDTPLPPGVSFNDVAKLNDDLKSGVLSTKDRQVYRELFGRRAPSSLDVTSGVGEHGALRRNAANRAAGTTAPGVPIHSFALPTNIQDALAAALTPAQDRAAARAALDHTQKLLNTGRLVGQAYTDALNERKKLYAEIARDSKKLAGGTGGSLLPLGTQESLAAAQGAAATKSLPALQTLLGEQEKALSVLRSQNDTGAARLKQLKEETALQRQIATTQKEIANAQQTAAKGADAALARRILGLGPKPRQSAVETIRATERKDLNEALAALLSAGGGTADLQRRHTGRVTRNQGFGRSIRFGTGTRGTSAAELAQITRETAGLTDRQLVDLIRREFGDKLPKATLESLEKVNKVLGLKFLPPDVLANLRSRLAQIKATLQAGLSGINQTANNYKGVSASQFVAGIPGLTRAQKIALEEKYSQIEAHGGRPVGPAAAGIVIPSGRGDIHLHNPVFNGVQNLDHLITQIEKRNRHKVQRGGAHR